MLPLLKCLSPRQLVLSILLAIAPIGTTLAESAVSKTAPTAAAPAAANTIKQPAATAAPKAKTSTVQKKPVAKKPATKKTVAKKQKAAAPAKKKVVAKKASKPKTTAKAKRPAKPAPLPTPAFNPEQRNAYPNVAKAYLLKVGNDVIWEGEADTRLPPASLTKMMTALLVLESYQPNDIVTISPAAAAETGSRIGLRSGDRLQLSDLLAAALIKSANDACHALADWHSGSEAVFVARMNQRAEQLGMRDTHFENACGLDKPGHLSTARDMAVLAEEALKNPTFARLVVKPRMVIRSVDGRRTFHLKTTNHLIGSLDGIQGVKTGFTNRAGPCLVTAADRGDTRVLLVLLNSSNRWPKAASMIDNAFAQLPQIALYKQSAQNTAATTRPPLKGA